MGVQGSTEAWPSQDPCFRNLSGALKCLIYDTVIWEVCPLETDSLAVGFLGALTPVQLVLGAGRL